MGKSLHDLRPRPQKRVAPLPAASPPPLPVAETPVQSHTNTSPLLPGLIIHSVAGITFGYHLLWLIWFSWLFAAALRKVSSRNPGTDKQRSSKNTLVFSGLVSMISSTLMAAAIIQIMTTSVVLIFPSAHFITASLIILLILITTIRYKLTGQPYYFKLILFVLFLYAGAALLTTTNWLLIIRHLVTPTLPLHSAELVIALAIVSLTLNSTLPTQATPGNPSPSPLLTQLAMASVMTAAGTLHIPAASTSPLQLANMAAILQPVAGDLSQWLFGLILLSSGLIAAEHLTVHSSSQLKTSLPKLHIKPYTVLILAISASFISHQLGLSPVVTVYGAAIIQAAASISLFFLRKDGRQ